MLRRQASETLSYQLEVDKGKLTAVANFGMLTLYSIGNRMRPCKIKD